jgi:DNA-binding response OmpR family regulator
MPVTCLIAAHDPWFIQLLRIYSEESGFKVVQVYEGQDVLPMITQEKPAAIFLQADLPGKTKGWEVLHLLKANPDACTIPVLVFSWLSSTGTDEFSSEILNGAAAHLQEPVTFEIFQEALHKAGIANDCPPAMSESDKNDESSGGPKHAN